MSTNSWTGGAFGNRCSISQRPHLVLQATIGVPEQLCYRTLCSFLRLRRGVRIMVALWGKNMKNLRTILILGSLFLVPAIAHAAQPWDNTLDTLIGVLRGTTARAVATLVCVAIGYAAWVGKMSWKMAGSFVGGIVLVFGASAIVDLIVGGTGA